MRRSPVTPRRAIVAMILSLCLLVAGALLDVPRHAQAATLSGIDWGAGAARMRGQNGARFDFACPALGQIGRVWGTGIYTDDSSVCTAALHDGKLDHTVGGIVTIEIRPGQRAYAGSTQHGVTSKDYGAWYGSYIVVSATRGEGGLSLGGASWQSNAGAYEGAIGTRYAYICLAGGIAAPVWGSNTYTSDSSVCTAAVHAGLITFIEGGVVTILIAPGQDCYVGSTFNGVTTREYGRWRSTFSFPDARVLPIAACGSPTAASTPTATGSATTTAKSTATTVANTAGTATATTTSMATATSTPTAVAIVCCQVVVSVDYPHRRQHRAVFANRPLTVRVSGVPNVVAHFTISLRAGTSGQVFAGQADSRTDSNGDGSAQVTITYNPPNPTFAILTIGVSTPYGTDTQHLGVVVFPIGIN
jgi:hypothetical protein